MQFGYAHVLWMTRNTALLCVSTYQVPCGYQVEWKYSLCADLFNTTSQSELYYNKISDYMANTNIHVVKMKQNIT